MVLDSRKNTTSVRKLRVERLRAKRLSASSAQSFIAEL
jgi:hypothetical protein